MCTSTVSSNFALAVDLIIATAVGASNRRSSPSALRLSRYFLPCFAIAFSLADLDAHRARGARDDLHGGLDIICVEVVHLLLRDFAHGGRRQLAHLLAIRLAGAFLDVRGLLDQLGSWRGLQDERERAVFEDGDDCRGDLARVFCGSFVIRLTE